MLELKVTVEKITYQNPDNGYSILKCFPEGENKTVTVVGNMPGVNTGSVLILQGDWKHDRKYGDQFAVENYRETLPAGIHGIEKYLGSGLIKGIGPVYAKKIIKKFGKDSFDVLDNAPERLLEVPGIGQKRADRIREGWNEQKEVRNIMLFLQEHDISVSNASKIYQAWGNDSIEKIKENPFRLADEIYGIGFKSADVIASKLGIGKDEFIRLRSGIVYVLNEMASDGHTFAYRDQLLEKGSALLDTGTAAIEDTLDRMCASYELIREDDRIYLESYCIAEDNCAMMLERINEFPREDTFVKSIDFEKLSKDTGIEYNDVQQIAILTAVRENLMVLTGGPGTGKTTVMKGIIKVLNSMGLNVLLAAPTGRAAKRMSEATGMEAKTVHRLLEYAPQEGFKRCEDNPLEGDALIIDESSMLDLMLFQALLKAVPPYMKLILVGDKDQLPSVGAGNVFSDVISARIFHVIWLSQIYRQAESSRIIVNAHRVHEGLEPVISNSKNSDFFFIEENDTAKLPDLICDLVGSRLPEFIGCSPSDIQVLTPMQKGECGAMNLNAMLQEKLNPNGLSVNRGSDTFRIGDKVMQIKNNYEKDVFNGDIGTVTYMDTVDRCLTVNYDVRRVTYEQNELDELTLAYAITIHKSQGSEYPAVVMPVTTSHYVMLQRNLIYTGITRAKKLLVLVGNRKALSYAISNVKVTERNSYLAERLNKYYRQYREE